MNYFQDKVRDWMHRCFSAQVICNKTERSNRFLEEALELVQAGGYSKENAHRIVDYVYNRPKGEIGQEVGGVMITLAALCNEHNISFITELINELERVDTPEMIEKIRAKQAQKINDNVA